MAGKRSWYVPPETPDSRYATPVKRRGVAVGSHLSLTSLGLDWPDRTIGLGPDRTGLICKQSGPKF